MQSFQQFVSEEVNSLEQLGKTLQKEFKSQFPKGWSFVGGSNTTLKFTFGLVDKSELSSQILDNDPMFHMFLIRMVAENTFEAVVLRSGISIDAPKESFNVMATVKTSWRKTKGDQVKIVKTFGRFFTKIKGLVKKNESNIHNRAFYSNKYFKF